MRNLLWAPVVVAALLPVSCSKPNTRGDASRIANEPDTSHVPPSGAVLSYADTVDRVAPAVVTIRSARRVRQPQQFPFFNDPFFRQFFGGRIPGGGGGAQVEHALGSGVIVQSDGHIVTNQHVIDGAEDIKVDLSTHRTFAATLVGSDRPSDLAVLKINTSGLPVLALGDSDRRARGRRGPGGGQSPGSR